MFLASARRRASNFPQIPKRDVSLDHANLIEMMQRINFGRIEQLPIRNGRPVIIPRPKVIREVKFGGENGPRPEIDISDFLLKSQVVELFAHSTRCRTAPLTSLKSSMACRFARSSGKTPPHLRARLPR